MGSLKSDGTWNYYWKRGRELGSMVSDDTTWTYSYNGDGIRIGRTDGTNTYTYIYNGDKLTRVQYNGKLVRYNYDESGNPISLRYNNVLYFVDTNLQGDVVGIRRTSDNARVVNYVYDAYGKICSITGSMKDTLGVHNVLRYRGYVYDQETGLYYLQSRYYNPEWGRFISADGFVATGQGFAGNNMFVYCGNNPANNFDPSGRRHCSATSVRKEKSYDRSYSCYWQRQVTLEKYNPTPIGRTDLGYVYMVKNESMVKTEFPGDIVIIDRRNTPNDKESCVQIRNSSFIKDKCIQHQVLFLLDQYELSNPSKWKRNTDIDDMMIEWDAHNDIFALWANTRCQHVDIDNKDKGTPYLGYWWRAFYETLF